MSETVIIGAGPAGMRAAATLVEAGIRPVVIDEQPRSGGQIFRRPPPAFARTAVKLYGDDADRAVRLHAGFDGLGDSIDWRPETIVWDATDEKLHLNSNGVASELNWEQVILCTGAMDRVIPLPGWTLPGVYSLGGAQVALKAQGCTVGSRVVLAGSGPLLYLVACQYADAGAEVAAVLETASFRDQAAAVSDLLAGGNIFLRGLRYLAKLALKGIPVYREVRDIRVIGEEAVEGISWFSDGSVHEESCDAVAMGFGLKSETQLADLLGVGFDYRPGEAQFVPISDDGGRSDRPGVYLAGDGAGIGGSWVAEIMGEIAAWSLVADRGGEVPHDRIAGLKRSRSRLMRFRRGLERAFPFPSHLEKSMADNVMVCRCEGVSAGEIRSACDGLGAREVNRAKAFSRAGMGRCQGRLCGLASAHVIAEACGSDIATVGRLRGQAPVKPLPVALRTEEGRS
jgi:NADPH-dependent 2,4-dienoyl-CoA reductase/sulfur reductase-like enzyme